MRLLISPNDFSILGWKFIQTDDIQDTDSYSYSLSLFQVVAHGNPLLNNDSYEKYLSAYRSRPTTWVKNEIHI